MNIERTAKAFEIPYLHPSSLEEFNDFLKTYQFNKPYIIEITTNPDQQIQPRQSFTEINGKYVPNPLSKMDPPLSASIQNNIDLYEAGFSYCPENEQDLLRSYPSSTESRAKRISAMHPKNMGTISDLIVKEKLIREARNYGKEYFDGNRLYGYGGYQYDPKYWSEVAKDFVEHFSIPKDSSILDIGCAKGYFLFELQQILNNPCLNGIDISTYAINCAHPLLNAKLNNACISTLFESNKTYDYIFAINLLSELSYEMLIPSLQMIERLSLKSSYINLLTWNSESEREMIDAWNITSRSILTRAEWLRILQKASYKGYYSFTTLSF